MKSALLRPWLYVVGIVVAVGTLVGARFLAPGGGPGDAPPDAAKSKMLDANTPGKTGSGPVVIGFVDTDPPVVKFTLPPNMQTGLVAKVFVKEGQEVKAGAELFAFDSTLQEAVVKKAATAVASAEAKHNSAKAAVEEHEKKLGVQQEDVEVAKLKVSLAEDAYRVARLNLLDLYKTSGFAEDTWEERLSKDPKMLELSNNRKTTPKERDVQQKKLEVMKSASVHLLVKEAEAAVDQAKAEVQMAKAALDLCTVKAHVPGVIERLGVAPGDVLAIGSQTPAIWFVPTGPRIVRAEVESDFAHRVMMEIQSGVPRVRELTVYDNNDSKITYKGVLKRVGTSFLPPRNGNEGLLGNDKRVLECVIEVADYAPAKGPPLRVGQKVRVNFGP